MLKKSVLHQKYISTAIIFAGPEERRVPVILKGREFVTSAWRS
jgi:hypothetical protein